MTNYAKGVAPNRDPPQGWAPDKDYTIQKNGRTNTLAYFNRPSTTKKKKFYNFDTRQVTGCLQQAGATPLGPADN